jgi:nucleotide-binding universal stress UspA family protein
MMNTLKEWISEKVPDDIPVQPIVAEGKARDAILKIESKIDCDLILLSSSREKSHFYTLGATAAHVVRHAKCSVMIVR